MMAYGDVLRMAPPMVKDLNDHLLENRGDGYRLELAVTMPRTHGQACGLTLALLDEAGTTLATEICEVPAASEAKDLHLLLSNCQQYLLLKLADQTR